VAKTDLRERRLRELLREHEALVKREEEMVVAGRELGKQLATLLAAWDDPVVLVRGYGMPWIFHSKDAPCGRVQNPENFLDTLLSEAKAMKLKPCSACG
jgi:hypothetical protein